MDSIASILEKSIATLKPEPPTVDRIRLLERIAFHLQRSPDLLEQSPVLQQLIEELNLSE